MFCFLSETSSALVDSLCATALPERFNETVAEAHFEAFPSLAERERDLRRLARPGAHNRKLQLTNVIIKWFFCSILLLAVLNEISFEKIEIP